MNPRVHRIVQLDKPHAIQATVVEAALGVSLREEGNAALFAATRILNKVG